MRLHQKQPVLAAGCLLLGACVNSAGPGPVTASAPVAEPVFTEQGILAGATGKEIDFQRAEPGAIAAMSKLMGSAPASTAGACPGLRAARWPDGTTLFFETRPFDPPAFIGWQHGGQSAGRVCAS
ncbi:hypothetical protein [Tropicimonas sp. IMCC6043]|uniref:hypothetical protein n=1 Tax=Tropicimonas sp. IMCC6043 TaxID=2510645 RepID=UPI00101BCA0E|nr:hypothetical protein [Tropicimonas sp. IMCC6043]RYH10899.1 hypothetical protein EU800_06500 [Tropicimonas sp. IMCC6043]